MSAMETGATAPTEAGGPNEAARDADTIEEKMAVEEKMAMLLRDGNVAGMQELLRSARMVNVRMVNMVLSAELESGCPIERAAVNMLQTCRNRKLAPSAALYNNVLGALSKRAPPEQVLHHPPPVRVPVRVSCFVRSTLRSTLRTSALTGSAVATLITARITFMIISLITSMIAGHLTLMTYPDHLPCSPFESPP